MVEVPAKSWIGGLDMYIIARSSKALAAVASKAPSANAIFMAQQLPLPQSSFLDLKRRNGFLLGLQRFAEQGACIHWHLS
jgi:hypothetical protein